MAISKNWYQKKSDYYTDFITVPLIVIASLYIGGFSLWIFAGIATWSFAEYMIHRYYFHITYRNEHWLHHVHEMAYVGISSYKTTGALLILAFTTYIIGCLPFFVGFIIGYFIYMAVHDTIHHKNIFTKYIPALVRNHELHHIEGIEMNFGVSSPIWDYILGTYKK